MAEDVAEKIFEDFSQVHGLSLLLSLSLSLSLPLPLCLSFSLSLSLPPSLPPPATALFLSLSIVCASPSFIRCCLARSTSICSIRD